jgi:hypothetical protein
VLGERARVDERDARHSNSTGRRGCSMPDRSKLYGELEADLRRRRIEDAERLLD